MNDRRINDLVRMAMEVDGLEQSASGAQLRLVGDEEGVPMARTRRGKWWAGAGLAAAAGLALFFVLPAIMHEPTPPGPISVRGTTPERPTSANPAPKMEIVRNQRLDTPAPMPSPRIEYPMVVRNAQDRTDPGAVERCIVVAIYRDERGQMHCVKVKPQEWSENRCLSEISQQELRCVSVGQACSSSADHALLVALSGPQRSLPKTEADAVKLAGCILGSPCENDSRCYAHAAAECLPAGISVKIETTADGH